MTDITNRRIRIAIQKSGRLSEESFGLLKKCGIEVKFRNGQLFCHSDNFPLDVLLVRDDDIPNLVSSSMCDFGILGTNVLQEKLLSNESKKNINKVIEYLSFGKCRLSIAVPKNFSYQNSHCLRGLRIATSYPYILSDYLRKNNIAMEITTLTGSVEIAPRLGISDSICDLVSTGGTLEANNLVEVETIFESQAVLIQSPFSLNKEKKKIAKLFQNRIAGAELANGSKYIMLHAPKAALPAIVCLLPGVERPTILQLEGDDQKVAVHALCREYIFWETMEQLKIAGASSILVLPVEKMMT